MKVSLLFFSSYKKLTLNPLFTSIFFTTKSRIAMKDRGKAAATEAINGENTKISDFNYSVSSDIPCIKHPNSSPIGICSSCLKDKLLNLSYSDQFFSDDTEINYPCVEVGSVGRISFLLENEKQSKTEQVILLRSSSNSVEIKKNRNGFWKIKRFFKKNSEISGPIEGVVSRSRSLCSFRGGGGGDDGSSDYRFSSAKISDVTGGLLFDDFKNHTKKCSDSPKTLSILKKNTIFKGFDTIFLKNPSNVTTMIDDDDEDDDGDSGFIDLKLDLLSEPKLELFSESGNLRGGSCRMNEYDRMMKKGKNGKGNRVWKWIFRKSKRDKINSTLIIKS